MSKIRMWITSDDGEGFVLSSEFDSIEDVQIHTDMFNNCQIGFETLYDDLEIHTAG